MKHLRLEDRRASQHGLQPPRSATAIWCPKALRGRPGWVSMISPRGHGNRWKVIGATTAVVGLLVVSIAISLARTPEAARNVRICQDQETMVSCLIVCSMSHFDDFYIFLCPSKPPKSPKVSDSGPLPKFHRGLCATDFKFTRISQRNSPSPACNVDERLLKRGVSEFQTDLLRGSLCVAHKNVLTYWLL